MARGSKGFGATMKGVKGGKALGGSVSGSIKTPMADRVFSGKR